MNLIFDLGGTLTDPGAGFVRRVQHAFLRLQLAPPSPETIGHQVGPPLRETLAHLLGAPHDWVERGAPQRRHRIWRRLGVWRQRGADRCGRRRALRRTGRPGGVLPLSRGA